jgi:folate-binding protein YgfZ
LAIGPTLAIDNLAARWVQSGAEEGRPEDIAAARIKAGFPTFGREIDDRTLPQEVGIERFGAVSYDKGCYVGQETVARLHFRGHANWGLRRFRVETSAEGELTTIRDEGGKEIVRPGSKISLSDSTTRGLAKVRREVPVPSVLRTERGSAVSLEPL